MRRKIISKILVLAAVIFALGYSYKSVVAQDSTTSATTPPSLAALQNQADIEKTQAAQKQLDKDNAAQKKADQCHTEKLAYDKYKHAALDCPSKDPAECEKQAKKCVAGYDEQFEADMADAKAKALPKVKDEEVDDAPDPDAKVPKEGDPGYCQPNGKDVAAETATATKVPAPTTSGASTGDSQSSGTPTPTECEQASLSDKMNILDDEYKKDKALSLEKQNDYLTAVQQTQADQAKCSKDLETAKSQLATLQGQAAALPSQEERAISGASVPQQAAIQEAQAAQLAAQRNVDMIKAKASSIEADYANQLSAALTVCYGNLQTMAGTNSLNRGAGLSQVLGQAQGGITSNKCQTNFMYQQASARAWRAYITQLQQNQADYMAAQAQVDLAYAHIKTVQYAGTQKDADTIQHFAELHQSLDQSITSANSALTSQGNICSSQTALDQSKEKTAMLPSTAAADRAREEYCEGDYLKKKYHAHPTGGKDKETEHMKDLHKVASEYSPDPCADGEKAYCYDTSTCPAPIAADACDGPTPASTCPKKPAKKTQ